MKAVTLSVALILLALFSKAQTQKTTVYCQLYPTLGGLGIDYYNLGKFLPDSLKATVMIDYKKQYRLRDSEIDDVLLLMSADGWRLITVTHFGSSASYSYILGKEILMDETAHQLYMQKIKGTFKPI